MPSRAFQGLVRFLKELDGSISQAEIARSLGIEQSQVSRYQHLGPTRVSSWTKFARRIYELGYRNGQTAAAQSLMTGITQTFGDLNQADLASALHVSQPTVSNWLRGSALPSPSNFEKLLGLHVSRLAKPILEFAPVLPRKSGQSWRVDSDANREEQLRNKLRGRIGIYVFYDSAGRVTYLGKTESDLWIEVKQRLKGNVNRAFYKPKRQTNIQQGEVARFLSAYEVRVQAAIHNLEVLMLRAFPNDLANTNTGNFKKGL